jgi:glycosyltransferase involved in cell wall biosynthesis
LHPVRTAKEMKHYRASHLNPLRGLFYKHNIQLLINQLKPKIVHVHNISQLISAHYAIQQNRMEDKPLLMQTFHGVFYKGNQENLHMRDQYEQATPLAQYVTGLTQEMLHEITDYLHYPKEKVAIIPNGVDTKTFFYDGEQRLSIRKQLGIEDEIVFVTVGSVQQRKGQLKFVQMLEDSGLNYRYLIIGDGPDRTAIERYCAEHQLENRVSVLGYMNNTEIYKYYSAADIYAHVSTMEGQALSEIEAYSTGLPVLVNKLIAGTIIGEIHDEKYFILDYDHLDKLQFAKWSQRNAVQENRQLIYKYDWSVIAGKYAELYKKLLDNNCD